LRRGAHTVSYDRVEHGALHRDLAGVAELPRPGRSRRLGRPAEMARDVHALPIPPEMLEHTDQGTLSELARAARCDLEPTSVSLHQPGLLQGPLDLLQPPQIANGVLAEGPAEGVLVDVVDGGAG